MLLLKIGEFAQVGNVSIRALRFYHEAGLLEPSHVDPSTNYRSYEPRQLQELQNIRLYKAMQFSLAEIRELLREPPSASERREILRERRALLRRRIRDDLESLVRIDAQLDVGAGARNRMSWRVEVREIRPVWVAAFREKICSYEEADGLFVEIERRIRPDLLAGKRAALWHTCANDGPRIDCEALHFLKRPAGPTPRVRVYPMPGVRVASLFHTGTDNTIPQAYQALHAWLARNRFVSSGPKCEIYWIESPKGSEGESLTEIRLPIFPAANRSRTHSCAA